MLEMWLEKFPSRAHEIICAYVHLLERDDLKSRIPEFSQSQIEMCAVMAPCEVLWHIEAVSPSLSLKPTPSAQRTSLVTSRDTDAVGQSLSVPVRRSGTPTDWNYKQKVEFEDELHRPEDHVHGYKWLNCGWDRYG